jgi:hypothetical protein
MVRIEFATSNDSFVRSFDFEVASQLRILADRVERGEQAGIVQDSNGNTVGKWEATQD